jgi:hypothetical protein
MKPAQPVGQERRITGHMIDRRAARGQFLW